MSYVLVITGTRDGRFDTWGHCDDVVAEHGRPRLVVLGGDQNGQKRTQRGVDMQARQWAESRGLRFVVEYALWGEGDHAGPERNGHMAAYCATTPKSVVLALPGPRSKGTYDCRDRCVKLGALPITKGPMDRPKLSGVAARERRGGEG